MGNQTCIKSGEMYMAGDGKKFEPAVRRAMTAVFNVGSTPYLRKLESEMTIQKIEVCPETFVQNLISYEQRNIYETTRGGEARKDTDRKHSASEYSVWDFKFDIQDYFKEEKRVLTVPGTTFTESCPECGSTGIITCPECEGTGKTECAKCGGTGEIPCPDCHGEGSMPCPTCNGTGKLVDESDEKSKQGHIIPCPDCDGTGRIYCKTCDGIGRIPCPDCHGSGETGCKKCAGTGKIKCPACKGSGSIINEVEVSSEIFVREDHNILFMSSLREDMVPFFSEYKPEFETHAVARYESSTRIDSISTGDFNFRVRETTFNTGPVFDKMTEGLDIDSASLKVAKYRVNVFQRIFLKITYTFNEKVYLMYYDCGEKKSYLTANPYNDVLQHLADEIYKTYLEKDYHEVALKLREFRSLSKASKGPVSVRNNPEKIAEAICDRFTLVAVLGMLIPLLFFLIFFSSKGIFSPSEYKGLVLWSLGVGLASIIIHYKTISLTWTALIRQMKVYAAYVACFGIGLLVSAFVEGLISYLLYVF